MRFRFHKKDLEDFFESIQENAGLAWPKIGSEYGVTGRNLFDWRRGKVSIPEKFLDYVREKYGVNIPRNVEEIDEREQKVRAAILGGKARIRLYGNPGTSEGRKLGGLRALIRMEKDLFGPFIARKIKKPRHTKELAELIGIILGDGGITERQVSISLHKEDDAAYSVFVCDLFQKIFGERPSATPQKRKRVILIRISRVAFVKLLGEMGLHPGNKVKEQVAVPRWIIEDVGFSRACVRGLLDTDGCFYIDRHLRKNTLYSYCALNFTNRSLPLVHFYKKTLEGLGLHPTQTTKYAVFLRREPDIKKYFKKIGTSNEKIVKRYQKFFFHKNKGKVPKRSQRLRLEIG